jgi:hypothetical protein
MLDVVSSEGRSVNLRRSIPARGKASGDQAIAARPEKSDRPIAEKIGVSSNTVRRARKTTGPDGAVEKWTGRDGKATEGDDDASCEAVLVGELDARRDRGRRSKVNSSFECR